MERAPTGAGAGRTYAEVVPYERLRFGASTLAGSVHAVDEVFFAEEAYRAIPVAILSALAVVLYPRIPPLWRGIAALVFGAFWLGGILTHWIPAVDDGPVEGDYTSVISVTGGAMFVVLAIEILTRDRRRRAGYATGAMEGTR